MAIDSAGRIYVADAFSIFVLAPISSSAPGAVLAIYNHFSPSIGYADGIALDASLNIYVSDQANNRVVVLAAYTSTSTTPGTQLASLNDNTSLPLNDPAKVAIDTADRIHVADFANNRIVVLAPLTSATPGAQLFQFNVSNSLYETNGIALDGAGNIYIASSGNDRTVVLASLSSVTPAPGTVLLTVSDTSYNQPLASDFELAMDTAGRIFVSDYRNARVLVLAGLLSVTPPPVQSSPLSVPCSTACPTLEASHSTVTA